MEEILIKINTLRDELHEHNYKYYIEDTPIISDFEFDKKLEELQELELKYPQFFDPNSPTQRLNNLNIRGVRLSSSNVSLFPYLSLKTE